VTAAIEKIIAAAAARATPDIFREFIRDSPRSLGHGVIHPPAPYCAVQEGLHRSGRPPGTRGRIVRLQVPSSRKVARGERRKQLMYGASGVPDSPHTTNRAQGGQRRSLYSS